MSFALSGTGCIVVHGCVVCLLVFLVDSMCFFLSYS